MWSGEDMAVSSEVWITETVCLSALTATVTGSHRQYKGSSAVYPGHVKGLQIRPTQHAQAEHRSWGQVP